MIRPVAAVLLAALALCAQSDSAEPYTPWIDRAVAAPWLPALTYAAEHTGLPVAVVAELIGAESGFQNIPNISGKSSARGFGQQINNNKIMLANHLNPMKPPDSILGAALELRARLDANHGDLNRALRGYGTTTGMSLARRKTLEARFALAAVTPTKSLPAMQVQMARATQVPQAPQVGTVKPPALPSHQALPAG